MMALRQVGMVLPWALLGGVGGWLWADQRQQPVAPMQQQAPAVQPLSAPVTRASAVSSYHAAVAAAAPAVVNVFTMQKVSSRQSVLDDPALRRFFEFHGQRLPQRQQEEATSLGSGVIVDPRGYILTNNHVVAQADQITVALQDGRHAQARVVGTDPDSDLAVIQINLDKLPVLQWRSAPTQVGDVVLAIGNPFGVGQTVTQGIISATGRSGLGINTYEDFIQTDAAINPGNSGGALIDAQGHLLGINTAIFSRTGGSMGIGFAIPVSLARQVMTAIIQDGKVVRGWLGVEVQGSNPAQDSGLYGQPDATPGVQVMGMVAGGPADKAGLREQDRILTFNGQAVGSASQLIGMVAQVKPGTVVPLGVQRGNQQLNVAVTIGERDPKTLPVQEQADPLQNGEEWFNQ